MQEPDWSKVETFIVPSEWIPRYRTSRAVQRGVEKNLLFRTWGGIGDQICAEPTLRYAFKTFKDCRISLASERPELFSHLPFKDVYNLNTEQFDASKYFVFETIVPPAHIVSQYVSHCLTNCVDFPSLCALRSQLPNADKEIVLKPVLPIESSIANFDHKNTVCIHAGKHWPSKTFPKDWWDAVLSGLVENGIKPVLIGADTDDNRGTVDVNPKGCIDMRNKLSILESIYLLQQTPVLLTNDSSPLHMAASGDAWIGYIATCKHPDYITHWRHGEWQWREVNLGKGGMWDLMDNCPNKKDGVTVEFVDEATLRSWLPEPKEVVEWTMKKLS